MQILFYFLIVAGVIAFSFSIWRRLKEDYSPEQIFSSTILALLGGLLGFIIFDRWLPQFVFWGFLVGFVLFGLYAISKINLKLYEAWDAAALGLSWLSLFFHLGLLLKNGFGEKFSRALEVLPAIVAIVLFYVYLKNYRRFSWYPSGKIGFIGGSVACLYFVTLALVAIYQFWVLSFSSLIWTAGISTLSCIGFLVIVFSRSGRRVSFGKKK